MGWLNTVVILYALLNIGGGVEGFLAKHSVPSVISGVTAGILLVVGVMLASNSRAGYILCAIVALGDLGYFASAIARKGFALWPAGVMVAASAVVLVCLALAHFQAKAPA